MLEKKLQIIAIINNGASSTICQWIKSYLTERQQVVLYQGQESKVHNVQVGSPQGSILSPLLFLVLVADMEEALHGLEGTTLLSFADDTTVYASANSEEEVRALLENAAKRILCYMKSSGLSANPGKTDFIMFSRSSQKPIQVGEDKIQESTSIKLVGFILTKDLSWKKHLESLTTELKNRIGILRRLSWHLSRETLIECLTPVFMSKLQYGLSLICDPNLKRNCSTTKALQNLQNDAMRTVLGKRLEQKVSEQSLLGLNSY